MVKSNKDKTAWRKKAVLAYEDKHMKMSEALTKHDNEAGKEIAEAKKRPKQVRKQMGKLQ